MSNLSRAELNEEINFFRDFCGWSDKRIEEKLGLADGTLAQRKHRAARVERIERELAALDELVGPNDDDLTVEWDDAA